MMRIPLRHHGRFVPQQLLHLVEIDSALYQDRRKRMSQVVEMETLDFRLSSARRNERHR